MDPSLHRLHLTLLYGVVNVVSVMLYGKLQSTFQVIGFTVFTCRVCVEYRIQTATYEEMIHRQENHEELCMANVLSLIALKR